MRCHGQRLELGVARHHCRKAELVEFRGTGAANSYWRDGCNYFYHAQYRCIPVPETLGEDLFVACFSDDGMEGN